MRTPHWPPAAVGPERDTLAGVLLRRVSCRGGRVMQCVAVLTAEEVFFDFYCKGCLWLCASLRGTGAVTILPLVTLTLLVPSMLELPVVLPVYETLLM
jgi:hypothetical protein